MTRKEIVKKWYQEELNTNIKSVKEIRKGVEVEYYFKDKVGQELVLNNEIAFYAVEMKIKKIKGYKIIENGAKKIPIKELYKYENRIFYALKKAGINSLKKGFDYSTIRGIGKKSAKILNEFISNNIKCYKKYKLKKEC